MRAGQKMTAKDARNPPATVDTSAQRQQPSTGAGPGAQRTDANRGLTRGTATAAGGGLTQRVNPNAPASQSAKGGTTTAKLAPTTPSAQSSVRMNSKPASSSTRSSTAKTQPPPPQAPLTAVRGKVMTPANKYVHVPSNVLRCAPVSRAGGSSAPIAVTTTAPSNPKKALSRDEFFGTGGGSKKTQQVKSVLHSSKYFSASKKEDDRPREEGSLPPRSTTESNLTTTSMIAETPTTSWTATCTGGGRVALVPVTSVESSTFEAMVLSEDADVAPRRSLSLSSNPSQPPPPPPSASSRRPGDQLGAPSASAATESPRHSGRGSGLIQWLLSPILGGGRRPSSDDKEDRRNADWDRSTNDMNNNSALASTTATTTTLSSFRTSNESMAEVGRGSFQLPVCTATITTRTLEGAKLSNEFPPPSDTQRGSDVLSLFSEADAPSSPARKSATRASMALLNTPHFPPPPPNTPVGAVHCDTPARRSLSLDVCGSAARSSTGVPAAPPNTPAAAAEIPEQVLFASPPSQQDVATVGVTARPSPRSSTGWWPFSPAAPTTDQRDSATRSGSGSARGSTEFQAAASSIAAVNEEETAPPSSTVFPTDDGREDAGRFSSATGGWFGRIRNSLLLPMGSGSRSAHRGEREDPSSLPGAADAAEAQPKRRKSVVFRSPEALETRVEESFVVGRTTPTAVPTHNVDASSPTPILLRWNSTARVEAPQSASDQAPKTSSVGNAQRSDSPSRKDDVVAASSLVVDAAAVSGSGVGVTDAAASNEFALSPPPRPPAQPSLSEPESAVRPEPHEGERPDPHARSHAVDRHGRVLRKSTPAPADLQSQLLSPPILDSASRSATSPPPSGRLDAPAILPPSQATDADQQRVDFVIRNHAVPSALRMLTVGAIAGFLIEHNVAFDPSEKKAKLFEVARRLVFAEGSTAGGSATRKRSREEGDERGHERSLELPLTGAEEAVPTSAWTIADIRGYAQSKGIALPNGSVRKAELLRQVSASAGRSRSVSLALT